MLKENIKQAIKENAIEFIIIIIIIASVTLLLYVSDTRCLIKYIVGVPCPGCGLTRAWISFLKMDLRSAFKWHPLFWIIPFMIIIGVFEKGKVFENKRINRLFWIFIVILVLGVYSIRMIRLFPDQAPMDYNKQSLLYKWVTLDSSAK